ncbi:unnamed protein product [Meganyctiphanes norvegica]|uniref:Uncharacterized protein n=1 Tax=Meganyctiphanes norvegica TaxID=48144 RepID=A0AAV2Q2M0_MEGNR
MPYSSSAQDNTNAATKGLASISMLIGLHEWLQEATLDTSLCEGFYLCHRLENTDKSNFWVTAVISFMTHQHLLAEKSENLRSYLYRAINQKACSELFPQCR